MINPLRNVCQAKGQMDDDCKQYMGWDLWTTDSSRHQLALSHCSARIIHETGTCLNIVLSFQNEANCQVAIQQKMLCTSKEIDYWQTSFVTRSLWKGFRRTSCRFENISQSFFYSYSSSMHRDKSATYSRDRKKGTVLAPIAVKQDYTIIP